MLSAPLGLFTLWPDGFFSLCPLHHSLESSYLSLKAEFRRAVLCKASCLLQAGLILPLRCCNTVYSPLLQQLAHYFRLFTLHKAVSPTELGEGRDWLYLFIFLLGNMSSTFWVLNKVYCTNEWVIIVSCEEIGELIIFTQKKKEYMMVAIGGKEKIHQLWIDVPVQRVRIHQMVFCDRFTFVVVTSAFLSLLLSS